MSSSNGKSRTAHSPSRAHPSNHHHLSQEIKVQISQDEYLDEKAALSSLHAVPNTAAYPSQFQGRPSLSCPRSAPPFSTPSSSRPTSTPLRSSRPFTPTTPSFNRRYPTSPTYSRPRSLRIANLLKPWIPIILYAISSIGFLVAIAFWKAEVFHGLDQLAQWLKSDDYLGPSVIFFLIFLTTFPPLPLYSTLIVLSGYTFGAVNGAIISYIASLTGALAVFIISRTFFRESISRWLSCTITIKRVVKAIEKRPKLLFLIRLAPYPYNVMNCLLAASPSLSLKTYTICTALSLPKLIIHTSIGSSIHSFAEYHINKPGHPDQDESQLGHYSTIIGIILCIAIFVYLSYIARKAVDDELEDDATGEETTAFLADDEEGEEEMMSEAPFRPRPSFSRPSTDSPHDRFNHAGREEANVGL